MLRPRAAATGICCQIWYTIPSGHTRVASPQDTAHAASGHLTIRALNGSTTLRAERTSSRKQQRVELGAGWQPEGPALPGAGSQFSAALSLQGARNHRQGGWPSLTRRAILRTTFGGTRASRSSGLSPDTDEGSRACQALYPRMWVVLYQVGGTRSC